MGDANGPQSLCGYYMLRMVLEAVQAPLTSYKSVTTHFTDSESEAQKG